MLQVERGYSAASKHEAAHPSPVMALHEFKHDLFISYAVNPDKDTFQIVRAAFQAHRLNVFNPDMDMSRLNVDGGASVELMQEHVRVSKLVLAIISRGGAIFKSECCRAELTAAKDAGIPVMPVYNGDKSSLQDVKDHIDGKVEGLGEGTDVYQTLIKYVFKEYAPQRSIPWSPGYAKLSANRMFEPRHVQADSRPSQHAAR